MEKLNFGGRLAKLKVYRVGRLAFFIVTVMNPTTGFGVEKIFRGQSSLGTPREFENVPTEFDVVLSKKDFEHLAEQSPLLSQIDFQNFWKKMEDDILEVSPIPPR